MLLFSTLKVVSGSIMNIVIVMLVLQEGQMENVHYYSRLFMQNQFLTISILLIFIEI